MDLLILSQGASFSPIKLFMDADLVVKAVIIGLALASIWVWTIIVSFVLKIRGVTSQSEAFEREFWKTEDVDGYYKQHGKSDLPIARVFAAGLAEWRRSTAVKTPDRQGTRERLATAMDASIAAESEKLANRLNFLATTGAVAPFVGLFGTVWGIMRSFSAIAAEQNSSLAVVAPGIAEALFATAIGLFAAIPAVIAYNRFSHRVDQYEARMGRFADGFHGLLSRELEREG
ncbi:MAG: protein TolQ [Sphingomonadales bacterium]|jgi:biopolymer transport protein TolQ|nr:protein TolQ [Sphingomonadales bacterium]MBK9002629.1 protein TolQ [Sphingomonadales bacterium]MBK9267850.1 protein TolQ [Sphingomonadales bacterium]MBP6433891.1 protein TolQ [Sphingorhabdus sp.]